MVVSESLFGLAPFPVLPGISGAGSTSFPLKLAAVVSAIYGLYSFTLPASPPQGRDKPVSFAKVLGLDAVQLFKDPSWAIFALCSFLICIPLAFYYARTNEFVSMVAFGDSSAGVMALGQVSEILFMLLVPFFLRRLGVKMMLLVGMLAWAARYALFGMMPATGAMVVLGIVLHGICYDFFFVTGQLYTDRKAPESIRTSAQALLGLLTYGAGMLVGNLIPRPLGGLYQARFNLQRRLDRRRSQFLANARRTGCRDFHLVLHYVLGQERRPKVNGSGIPRRINRRRMRNSSR